MLNFSICLVMINKNKNREGEKWVGTKVYWIISKVHGGREGGRSRGCEKCFRMDKDEREEGRWSVGWL